ncbi:MAG: DUF58 domain-containing protein [Gammaproteobacteria bacterium]|nr:DUF58 domain-containing protein [Gammaproteobacteria bacterium]
MPAFATSITIEDLMSAQFIAKKIKFSKNKKPNINNANNLTRTFARGMEYAESRIYQPGDDARHIDWRLTARHAKTYSKLYHEEKGENNYIILDLSTNMYFGTSYALKAVIAARAAAIIAWLSYNEQNNIGSIVMTNNNNFYLPAKFSKHNVLSFFNNITKNFLLDQSQLRKFIEQSDKSLPDNLLNITLSKYDHTFAKNSRIFIISDFTNIDSQTIKKIEKYVYNHFLYLIKITDPIENSLLPIGEYTITNGQQSDVINITKGNQDLFATFFQQKLENYYKLITKLNIKTIDLTSEPNWHYNLAQQL